jgi:hypothetical protein
MRNLEWFTLVKIERLGAGAGSLGSIYWSGSYGAFFEAGIMHRSTMKTHPSLGIFWIYRRHVVAFSVSIGSVATVQGTKDSDFAHADSWKKVQKKIPNWPARNIGPFPVAESSFEIRTVYSLFSPPPQS